MFTSIKKQSCCAAGSTGLGRRICSAAGWLLPGTLLVLMPKCPLCIVAYIAAFSGIGISVSAASDIRVSLIALCLSALLFGVARYALKTIKR